MKSITINRKSWHWKCADMMNFPSSTFDEIGREKAIDQYRQGYISWVEYDSMEFEHPNEDFCQYVRYVILGMVMWALLGAMCAFVLAVTLCTLADLYWLVSGQHEMYKTYQNVAVIGGFAFGGWLVVGICFGSIKLREYKRKRRNEKLKAMKASGIEPEETISFVSGAYQSFKNKMCFRMKVQ